MTENKLLLYLFNSLLDMRVHKRDAAAFTCLLNFDCLLALKSL
jgi:hypothetical protein